MEQHQRIAQTPIRPTRKVLDASVLLKWVFLQEEDAEKALVLVDEHIQGKSLIIVPTLAYYEFANVIQRPSKRLTAETIFQAIEGLFDLQLVSVNLTERYLKQAMAFASQSGSSVYDCCYVVLAAMFDCELITADERAYRSLRRFPFVRLLAEI